MRQLDVKLVVNINMRNCWHINVEPRYTEVYSETDILKMLLYVHFADRNAILTNTPPHFRRFVAKSLYEVGLGTHSLTHNHCRYIGLLHFPRAIFAHTSGPRVQDDRSAKTGSPTPHHPTQWKLRRLSHFRE